MTRKRQIRALAVAVGLLAAVAVAAPAALAAPPTNSTRPTISGDAAEGQTLTASTGTWTNSPTGFQFQWLRCRADGAGCVAVPGAAERTYLLTRTDVGRRMRVRVIAFNADGAGVARSAPTAVVTATGAPQNTTRPTISGQPRVGAQLTADPGSWSGSPDSFAYQWQRCDIDVVSCFDVVGATARTYTVRSTDLGFRLRVEVRATSSRGSGMAVSEVSDVVQPAAPITNRRPALTIVSVRFLGARIYARFRICDDSPRNLSILATDSRPRRRAQTRRFSTRIPPNPCGVYTRNWVPAVRFRRSGSGRYTVTLRARDTTGMTSAAARRSFRR
jgi:hypothetical protein